MVIDEIIKKLSNEGILKENEIYGYEEEKIVNLEKKYKVSFPKVYRDFLKKLIKFFEVDGGFNNGLNLSYNDLFHFRSDFEEKIIDKHLSTFKLPFNAFVFGIRDFDIAYFFICENKKSDTEIFEFSSISTTPQSFSKSFSEFLKKEIDIMISDFY